MHICMYLYKDSDNKDYFILTYINIYSQMYIYTYVYVFKTNQPLVLKMEINHMA